MFRRLKNHLDPVNLLFQDTVDWRLSVAVFDEVMFFPSLQKIDGIYHAWIKVAGGPQVGGQHRTLSRRVSPPERVF